MGWIISREIMMEARRRIEALKIREPEAFTNEQRLWLNTVVVATKVSRENDGDDGDDGEGSGLLTRSVSIHFFFFSLSLSHTHTQILVQIPFPHRRPYEKYYVDSKELMRRLIVDGHLDWVAKAMEHFRFYT